MAKENVKETTAEKLLSAEIMKGKEVLKSHDEVLKARYRSWESESDAIRSDAVFEKIVQWLQEQGLLRASQEQ